MAFDYRNNPKWKGVAYSCGAEAQANGRSQMHADDRLDIAIAYGIESEKWVEIPPADREEARRLFWQGVEAEREASSLFRNGT